MRTGRCECGAVRFRSPGPWRGVVACHCEQCRRTSGHFWAATAVPEAALEITRDDGLVWFRSSGVARRGFCGGCGASLFYKHDAKDYVAIAAGCLDDTAGLALESEIFTGEKGAYYPLSPGIPHHRTWPGAGPAD